MSKHTPRHRTALILGADGHVGRAIALHFAREGCRVVLAGDEAGKLKILADLIEAKRGDALVTVIPREAERIVPVLRSTREAMGHYHYVVNAITTLDPPSDQPAMHFERALTLQKQVYEVVEGRGSVRFGILWPDAAGEVPALPEPLYVSVFRFDRMQTHQDETDPKVIRAAAAADTIGALLNAPPGACPVEVRIQVRELKSRPGE